MTRTLTLSVLAVPVALALVGTTCVPAQALTVTGTTITGDNTDEVIVVSCLGGQLSANTVSGDPCATTRFFSVNPAGHDDRVDLSAITAADFPALVSTHVRSREIYDEGDGYDTVVGSPLRDTIVGDGHDVLSGGDGNDEIEGGALVDGGGGDDTIVGSDSDQTMLGGAGDDRFVEVAGIGGVDGGPGTDSYEVDFGQQVVALGEPFHLTLGVDALGVVLGGSGNAFTIPVRNIEAVDITLLTGEEQSWDGARFGPQRVRGLGGIDALLGGSADDVLQGGSGNDVVTGNAGSDDLSGGEGDDTVHARDGVADRVDCGAGADTVVADAIDTVTGCETVQLPQVLTPPPAPAPIVPETSAIRGRKSYAQPTVARFGFSSPTPGAGFECRLDKQRWRSCASRLKVRTARLKVGKHTLRVRAVVAGVPDPTPSVRKFKVTD